MAEQSGVDTKVVGVDLDETSFNLMDPFFEFHNRRYGTSLSRASIANYRLTDLIGCSEEELHRRFDEFNSTHLVLLQPMPGAVDVLRRLAAASYRLLAITSRKLDIERETKLSLERSFPGIFSELHMTGQSFDLKVRYERTKGTLCRDHRIGRIVDDSLEHAREIRKISPETRILLYDHGGMQPWNQLKPGETMPEGVQRVHTWEEIYEGILSP